MALRGSARVASQANDGQFCLVDPDAAFTPLTEFTPEMEETSLVVPAAGLILYTNGCLRQHLEIAIHGVEPEHPPAEPMNDILRTRTALARFPSQRFTISSPSHHESPPGGPCFLLDAEVVPVRIAWMEYGGVRDEGVPVDPDRRAPASDATTITRVGRNAADAALHLRVRWRR